MIDAAAVSLFIGGLMGVVMVIERAKTAILSRIGEMGPWSQGVDVRDVRALVDERVEQARLEDAAREEQRERHLVHARAEIEAVRKELAAMRKGSAYR